jgi:hypothetical protein
MSERRSPRYMLYRWRKQTQHRLGWHSWQHLGPMEDGAEFDHCDWCGANRERTSE